MKKALACIIVLLFIVPITSQEVFKLSSGEGLAFCDNANTHNRGDIWLSGFGRGFYWDNPDGKKGGFPLKIFPSGSLDIGILRYWDASFSTELLSYGFKIPGNFRVKSKITLPNNNKLRLIGLALSGSYTYNFLKDYSSIGGYRNIIAGFSPEGIMYSGGSFELRAISDVEFIKWKSFLPLKFYINIGYRSSMQDMPGAVNYNGSILLPDPKRYAQYIFFSGLEYKGLETDFFVEFYAEAFNSIKELQTIVWIGGEKVSKFPYYLSENPMYLTPGMRIKYSNGVMLMAALPILLSKEKGLTSTSVKNNELTPSDKAQGWTDGFSPFYANWKVTAKMSIPLHLTMSNAEMIRRFLLMKNRSKKQTMDIDEAIDKKDKKKNENKTDEEKMKDDIDKRKQEMMKENLLE